MLMEQLYGGVACVGDDVRQTACYVSYDIVIWSATDMKWVEVKMGELGVLSHPDYKITTLLDHGSMITVHSEKYGPIDVKPLGFLWQKFPEHYDETNTIMFDDLRRNFLMNPQNGLQIRPFRKAHQNMSAPAPLPRSHHIMRALPVLKREPLATGDGVQN